MRGNDPIDPQPWRPLGERVIPKPAAPSEPVWKPLDHDKRIERGPDGRLRTNIPTP